MLLSKSMSLSWNRFPAASLVVVGTLTILGGCQQAGTQSGFAGSNPIAPMNQLPGQPGVSGPTFPTLGPFGASARVPPPSTGSFQSAAASNANFNPNNYAPAGYAPNGIRPMSFDSADTNSASQSGQVTNVGGFGQNAATGSGWQETSADAFNAPAPLSDGLRSGGMPVSDLTGSPPPPGYYPSTSAFPSPTVPSPFGPNTTAANPSQNFAPQFGPVSGGGFATSIPNGNASGFSQPAANQPAFSTADRPIEWQQPRR